MKMLWATLLPKNLDHGGGSTYSAGVRRLLETELGGQFEEIYVLPTNKYWRKAKLLFSLIGSMFSYQSAKLLYCTSRMAIDRVRSSNADILVCDHVETAYLIKHFKGRAIVILHNVEGQLMQDRGAHGSWLKRGFLNREGRRMLQFETWALHTADDAISLSPDDISAFARLAPNRAIRHVPPLFSYVPIATRAPRHPPRLGFVGNLDWWPNAEALQWYLTEIHPHHALELYVVGAGDTSFLAGIDRVTAMGFVPDIRDVWNCFDVMIAPILSGSGVSIKTAEALYNGKPVIATPMGARGLPSPESIDGLTICSSDADWIMRLATLASGDGLQPPSPHTQSRFDNHSWQNGAMRAD